MQVAPRLVQIFRQSGLIFTGRNLNRQITEYVNYQSQQDGVSRAGDQANADSKSFVQPLPGKSLVIVCAIFVVEVDLPMNNEPDNDEQNRNQEKYDDGRQQNAPDRIFQSHQGHERFDQGAQRHGQ